MAGTQQDGLNRDILTSMGEAFKTAHVESANAFKARIARDAADIEALLGLADTDVLLFVFGYSAREETIPEAEDAVERAASLDRSSPEVSRLSGILSFLRWDWKDAEKSFLEAIRTDPQNLSARHWYSLLLIALDRPDEAMAQSDEILEHDPDEDYLVGRGSLFWFQHRFEDLKELMRRCIAKDPTVPWPHDWLGMAYNGLEEHENAIRTYRTAFELSDGTAEVGAGYAHALGEAGETDLAREMADFYAAMAKERYVPPVQRAYIHIGLGEYGEALRLLEEAFDQRSWFLCFAKVEPWLDPLRSDPRFVEIQRRIGFPSASVKAAED